MITVPHVSVVMVSYRTGPALWLSIESVLAQPECHQLILVDNGNTPGIEGLLHAFAQREPRLKLITGQGNAGFAKGCSLGAKAATGDYILLLNPDSMLPEGALAKAVEILGRFPEQTLAGCYLMNPDGSEQRGCRRALLTPKNAVAESLGFSRFVSSGKLNYHDTPMPAAAHEIPAISGAFMMMNKRFYDKLGGLDEGYFLHMEDMDLCWRVHQAGGRVICMPEVKVIHFRSTSEAPGRVVEKHKTRGFIRYIKTHFKDTLSAPAMFLLTCGIWLRYALKVVIGTLDKAFVPPLAAKRDMARLILLYRLSYFGPQNASLKGKTIVVTGGSGQIGLCVTGKALARGAKVIATYHSTVIPFQHPNLSWVQKDIYTDTLQDLKGDVLIHTLSLWTLTPMLESVLDAGVKRIIAFGSTSQFSKVNSKNKHEQEIVEKLDHAEKKIIAFGTEKQIPATILRPTLIYGVGLDNTISRMADLIRRLGFLGIYGKGSGQRHPVQTQDLAEAALAVITNPAAAGKGYNLGGKQTMSYRVMQTVLFQYLGKKVRLIQIPLMPQLLDFLGKVYQYSHVNGEMARRMNQDLVFDISDAVKDFGYQPRGYLEGDVVI